jgi:hypothetical protein
MKLLKLALVSAALAASAVSAMADTVSLNFEGINATYPSTNYAQIENFYNGGSSNQGTSGTNFGIAFSDNALAICLNTLTGTCSNTSRGGLGPGSDEGGLFFLTGTQTFMNVAAGFTTGFSFNYVSLSDSGSVNVYDGLNGTGNILATLSLSPNAGSCPGYNAGFCPFSASGVDFSGTALSVGFAGVANQIVFDDVTFGSSTPGNPPPAIPEPGSVSLMLAGLGLVGLIARRRKNAADAQSSGFLA